MNKKVKKLLIIALVMLLLGAALCIISLFLGFTGNFAITNRGKYIDLAQNSNVLPKTEIESFEYIEISTPYDIFIEDSNDSSFYVEYNIPSFETVSCSVSNGLLSLSTSSEKTSYILQFDVSLPSFSATKNYVKVYCPNSVKIEDIEASSDCGSIILNWFNAGSLRLDCHGNIFIDNVTADTVTANSYSSDIESQGLTCDSFTASANIGDIDFSDLNIFSSLNINSYAGKIDMEDITSPIINIISDCSDVSAKRFETSNLTVNAENSDITLSPKNFVSLYSLNLNSDFGTVEINGTEYGSHYISESITDRFITVNCDNGDIEILSLND